MYKKFDLPQSLGCGAEYAPLQPMLPGLEDPGDAAAKASVDQDRASALFARNAWYWVALVMAAVQAATFILMVAR